MPKRTIVQDHRENFETLKRAIKADRVCLMDCIENATGEHVAVICAMNSEGEEVGFVPLARFFNGNPYELLTPPTP
jgi:hypothetical protein